MRRPPEINEWPRFVVTSGTIVLAIGVTLAYWGHWNVEPLMEDGNVRRWELWRLVTSALPHGSFYHLIFNVYWTWVFGTLVEEVFGHLRTAALFVLLAFGSGAADYALAQGGIGLSGVGYGLFGMLWVLSRRDPRFNGAVDVNTVTLFVMWFVFCIALDLAGVMAIANVAHGAGAILGGLIGWAISGARGQRVASNIATALLIVAALIGATVARPWVNLSKHGATGEFHLAFEALQANRNEEALRWFTDVTRMEPRNATAWFDFGIALARLDQDEDAIRAYAKARELEPANAEYDAAYKQLVNYVALKDKVGNWGKKSP